MKSVLKLFISPQNPFFGSFMQIFKFRFKMQGCVKNKPVQNRLHSPLKVHLFVNFGFQQDNQSLTQKHDENKFDLGSAPSKRRTKRTNKPINYNTQCTTQSFIVFLPSQTPHMILQPALSPPTRRSKQLHIERKRIRHLWRPRPQRQRHRPHRGRIGLFFFYSPIS